MGDIKINIEDLVFADGKVQFRDERMEEQVRKLLDKEERLVLAINLLCPPGGDRPGPQNSMCGCVSYSLDARITNLTEIYRNSHREKVMVSEERLGAVPREEEEQS